MYGIAFDANLSLTVTQIFLVSLRDPTSWDANPQLIVCEFKLWFWIQDFAKASMNIYVFKALNTFMVLKNTFKFHKNLYFLVQKYFQGLWGDRKSHLLSGKYFRQAYITPNFLCRRGYLIY